LSTDPLAKFDAKVKLRKRDFVRKHARVYGVSGKARVGRLPGTATGTRCRNSGYGAGQRRVQRRCAGERSSCFRVAVTVAVWYQATE
jgi:hypothetical protein